MTPTILEPVLGASIGGAGVDVAALLRRLYRTLATVRRIDREAVALRGRGVLPGYVDSRGREAALVGAALALQASRDRAFPAAHEPGMAIALGADPAAVLRSRRGGIDAALEGSVTHAVGWALGAKLDRTGGCALTTIGAGAGTPAELRDAVTTARDSALPVVFLSSSGRTEGAGMPVLLVDGADAVAVHGAGLKALELARSGAGPVLIDAVLPGPSAWPARDPLVVCEQRLRDTGTVGDAYFAEVADTADALADRLRARLTAGA
ncbi:thiamine pyrophosphate-dependent enzyme [Leifsonia shinshuensis]|uniref:2-oxoisovalerate dehydrogenase subunit alpha n=2 Tax=Leifsonia shinshuensis TaxID=150026 RepID=A0A853CY53_9MICO|nr:thiamine pyrophosphate-dependent enzyme [Leifsonia shinshuensis]NYJ25159.1 pyruvate dehydrogenase E1 component alpha subunit [Leifsonia shinshuensis]